MAQKGLVKNTASRSFGAPELSSILLGIVGGSGIIKAFNNLTCVKTSNNLVTLDSGIYSLMGHLVRVDEGTTEGLTIGSGTTGYNRNDLVVAEFVRNGSGAGEDLLHIKVIAGTPTTGTATDPTLTQEDINGSGTTRQEALYRVVIVGTTISAIVAVATKLNAIGGAAYHKSETGITFGSGSATCTVTDSFITTLTDVTVHPTSLKIGVWVVDSFDGYFVITSTNIETTAVTFDWGALK